MQFIHFGSPYIRPITETYALARFGVSGDAAVQTAQYGVRERAAFIERGSRRRLVPTTETRILEGYCLWTFKIPLKTQNPFSGSTKETEAFRKECDEFLKLRTRALSQLTVMGIQADILPTAALMGVLRRYFSVYEERTAVPGRLAHELGQPPPRPVALLRLFLFAGAAIHRSIGH